MALLNKQPDKRNPDALAELKLKSLKKYALVVTEDGEEFGEALYLHLRTGEVNPDLKMYAAYLEVHQAAMGNSAYIPTDFIDHYDAEQNRVYLEVPLQMIEQARWGVTPRFIAYEDNIREELAQSDAELL